jgi:hypothetical protein
MLRPEPASGPLSEDRQEELWAEALHIHGQRSRRIVLLSRACLHLAALLLPESARDRYVGGWVGEIDGLPLWRQVRFGIRVLVRMPATAHTEGSYARLARASVAWAFPREETSDEEMIRRLNSINQSAVPEHHKSALGMPVVIRWALTALVKRLGITTKSSDDNDGTR